MDSPARCLLLCSSVRICGFRPGKHSRSCSAFRRTQTVTSAFSVWNHSATQTSRYLATIVFDPLFEKGISLPSPCEPSLTICRSYSPFHNIGHFRFLECTHRSPLGAPSGEVALWDEIRFPFDPALASAPDLHTTAVAHSPEASAQLIEERYECDSGGSLTVTIANRTAAYSRTYSLGRWSLNSKSVKPVRKGKGKQ